MITLKVWGGGEAFDYEDVKEAIQDWLLYVKVINLLTANQDKRAKKLQQTLTDKYNCKWHELGFDKIFGDWEE